MATNRRERRIRRLAHPGRALAFLLSTLLIATAAFILGTFVRSPDASVLEARYESIPAYVSVTERIVDDGARIQGETASKPRQLVFAQKPESASSAVTTSNALAAGAELNSGDLLGTVSDRPIFILVLSIPLYRDIYRDDEGSDVASLQKALQVTATGKMNLETLNSVAKLYKTHDLKAPMIGDNTFVRMSEFYTLTPTENLRLESIAQVGSQLSEDTPFAELSSGFPFVAIRAGVDEVEQFAVDAPVKIARPDGSLVDGLITSIGPFDATATEAGRPPGRDITVVASGGAELAEGEAVTITTSIAAESAMAVPTISIRSDTDGSYVLRQGANNSNERVAVVPLSTAQGWTSIESDEVNVGDSILVSG